MRHLLLVLLGALAFAAAPVAAGDTANTDLGVDLPPYAKKLGEHRFESPRDYDATVKFYRDHFKGWKQIKWLPEVSLPTVKYLHIDNTSASSKWAGINIYQVQNGRVRVFVLAREPAAAEKAAPAKAPAK